MKPKEYKVKIPVINQTMGVFFYEKSDQFKDRFSEYIHQFEFDLDSFDAVSFENKEAYWIAFLVKDIDQGIIAHESKHIINKIFYNMGYSLDLINDEMECYFLQWVVSWVNEKWETIKNK